MELSEEQRKNSPTEEEVVIMKKFIKAVEKAEMGKEDQDTKEIPEELSQILFEYFNNKKKEKE